MVQARIDGGIHESPKSLNLICGIPSRIQGLNDCDELQTPEGWALVTDAKRIKGFYSNLIENRQMISRAVTEHLDLFH